MTIPIVRFLCQCETTGCVFGSWDQSSTDYCRTRISGSLGPSSVAPLIKFFKCISLRFGMYRVRTVVRLTGRGRYVLRNGRTVPGRRLDP